MIEVYRIECMKRVYAQSRSKLFMIHRNAHLAGKEYNNGGRNISHFPNERLTQNPRPICILFMVLRNYASQ